MKRILKVSTAFEFDHNQSQFSKSLKYADLKKATELAEKTTKFYASKSQIIEKIIFDNQETFQTRILALYVAGALILKESMQKQEIIKINITPHEKENIFTYLKSIIREMEKEINEEK